MEEIILKELLNNHRYFKSAISYLQPKHFPNLETQEIFNIIKTYYGEYTEIPSKSEIIIKIKQIKEPEIKKIVAQKFKEVISNPDTLNEDFLLKETEKYIKKQEFSDAILSGATAIENNGDLESIYKQFEDIRKINLLSDDGLDFTDIDRRIEYYHQSLKGIETGISVVDKQLVFGYLPKTLNIIAASSHVGKCIQSSELLDIYISDEELEKLEKSGIDFELIKE
jgi:replicative DNA helicase